MADAGKYDFIDALRGLAILGVVSVHASQHAAPAHAWLASLMGLGAKGVQLFFVASAVTLCMSWERRSRSERFPVSNYLLRRFFRIAPLFYAAIAVYLGMFGTGARHSAPDGIQWWYVPATAAFLHGLWPQTINAIVPGGWSIAVEMMFYVLLPWVVRRIDSLQALAAGLLGAMLLYGATFVVIEAVMIPNSPAEWGSLIREYTYMILPAQLPVFIVGMIAYHLLRFGPGQVTPSVVGLGAASVLLASVLGWRHAPVGQFVAAVAFGGFTLWLSAHQKNWVVRNPLARIGRVSYSMYICHFAILELLSATGISRAMSGSDVLSALHCLLVMLLAFPVATLLLRTLEAWGIDCGRRLIARREAGAHGGEA